LLSLIDLKLSLFFQLPMDQFTVKYKALRTADLLKIIDNPGDYQPLALETAEAELASRQLSVVELESAKTEIELELQEKELKKEKRQAFGNKVSDLGTSVVDAINPIQHTSPSTNRVINFLSATFGIMFLLTLFKEFSFITFMFFSKESSWGFSMLIYLLEFFIVPVLTVLFFGGASVSAGSCFAFIAATR
jgi:hypothetical protein